MKFWPDNKPYFSANQYYREIFGKKVYKISLDIGCTCPTRDGTKGFGGCTFCSARGSG
ncbi:MAG TPA: TIGR01212 family radical SAM protein, partial [Clostridiaceae bacterium]|nr:TIGR01212 family radical SAM protein [Clostridiaceae bacterium]